MEIIHISRKSALKKKLLANHKTTKFKVKKETEAIRKPLRESTSSSLKKSKTKKNTVIVKIPTE
jgi:hypothetical protein